MTSGKDVVLPITSVSAMQQAAYFLKKLKLHFITFFFSLLSILLPFSTLKIIVWLVGGQQTSHSAVFKKQVVTALKAQWFALQYEVKSHNVRWDTLNSVMTSQDPNWLTVPHTTMKPDLINPLNTKHRLLYLKAQFVPHSKHFSSQL